MNNYKTYCLSVVIFFAFIAVASGNEGFVQDTIPKQRPGNAQNDNTNKEQPKTDRLGIGIIKSVPKARRQAKPKIVKPNIDIIKTVRPIIRPKIKAPVRIKVKI